MRLRSARSWVKRSVSSRITEPQALGLPSGPKSMNTVKAIDIARPALSTAGTRSTSCA